MRPGFKDAPSVTVRAALFSKEQPLLAELSGSAWEGLLSAHRGRDQRRV